MQTHFFLDVFLMFKSGAPFSVNSFIHPLIVTIHRKGFVNLYYKIQCDSIYTDLWIKWDFENVVEKKKTGTCILYIWNKKSVIINTV